MPPLSLTLSPKEREQPADARDLFMTIQPTQPRIHARGWKRFSLSHRMGEGRGEGSRIYHLHKIYFFPIGTGVKAVPRNAAFLYSTHVFSTSVTSARNVSSDATANAPAKLFDSYKIWT
jgi:hypothetical protein